MMKLFAIYVGGEMQGANIEVHDMRFIAAPSVEATYDELLAQWWGKPGSLHIDCWAEIAHADGYDVALSREPFLGQERLYYVNLGGYDRSEFSEKHKNVFIVATTVKEAKARALNEAREWAEPHRDDMYEADQAFALDSFVDADRLYLHLERTDEVKNLTFTCDYRPIRSRVKKATETLAGVE
jgi:hypothetical protein